MSVPNSSRASPPSTSAGGGGRSKASSPTNGSTVNPKQKASLPLSLGRYFDSPDLSDVHLTVEGTDGQLSFHAHRLILSASSTYFASLFSKAWTSADAPQPR